MASEEPNAAPTCRVIRSAERYIGKQGPEYTAAISAESVGSRGIWFGTIRIPPGGRTKAHYHEAHETALYMLEGVVDMWYGERLEQYAECVAGDSIYIPAGVPHVAVNRSETAPALVIGARTDPNEQESVVLTPELERFLPGHRDAGDGSR